MKTLYQTLGVSTAATAEEIRRAYRVLARRYHPDVNPGRSSEDRFKEIAEAYAVLSDPAKRRTYDAELEKRSRAAGFASTFEQAHAAYQRAGKHTSGSGATQAKTARSGPDTSKVRAATPPPKPPPVSELTQFARLSRDAFQSIQRKVQKKLLGKSDSMGTKTTHFSLVEVSLSVFEAIRGVRKTVEITDTDGDLRKISVVIPPGARAGSVIRFRRKDVPTEEVVLIVRLASHPLISISARGITLDVPITVAEAIKGAKIQVPTLGEPVLVTVEPGTQSGHEVRLKGKGVLFRDGSRGDLLIRFLIKVPETSTAVGLQEKAEELNGYYERPVRNVLPATILEG